MCAGSVGSTEQPIQVREEGWHPGGVAVVCFAVLLSCLVLFHEGKPHIHRYQDREHRKGQYVGHWTRKPSMTRTKPTYCGWRT